MYASLVEKVFFFVVLRLQAVRQSVAAWVRQEIVDDDPYDVSTVFPPENEDIHRR